MSGRRGISRRVFVRWVWLGALVGCAAPAAFAAVACGPRRTPLRAALLGFFPDRESARRVGRAYLDLEPEEADADALVEGIAGSERRRWEQLAAADRAALTRELRARHRQDFGAGRVVTLRGWVLSRTEARLCALAALA